MFDKNLPIEQLMYTAGGTKRKGIDNANFGVYSASNGIDDRAELELCKKISTILKGDPGDYTAKYSTQRVLKKDATPHGIFSKKYKDSDYETKKIEISAPIEIITQSHAGNLRNAPDYTDDYRDAPEKAPHRVAATRLSDGRLMVVQIRAINRIYSDVDTRTGNYFAHALIFPKGTKLTDIDINSLTFKNGLGKKEWGKDGIEAPVHLPTTTLAQMGHQATKQSIDVPETIEEFVEVYKKTLIANKDYKSRMEHRRIFNNTVSEGTKLLDIKCIVKKICNDQLKSGKEPDEIYESLMDDLDLVETPHTKLLTALESLVECSKELDIAYENDDSKKIEIYEAKINDLTAYIDSLLDNFSIDELNEVVSKQKQYLKQSAEFDALRQGKTLEQLNGSYGLKNDFKAITKLEMLINKKAKKNKR